MNIKDRDKIELEALLDRRQILDNNRIEISNLLDKYILTISTGSLYLSIYFLSQLYGNINNIKYLIMGSILLGLTILATTLSFYFSEKSFDKQKDITDETLKVFPHKAQKESNHWKQLTQYIKLIYIVFFMLGILSLFYFYFSNII